MRLSTENRQIFRSIMQLGAATWVRGRRWALSLGIVAYPNYRLTHPVFSGIAKGAMDQVLAEAIEKGL